LKIEHPPKMCRILLVQHAKKHDAEEGQVHNKVNKQTPAENIGPRDETRVCLRAPYSTTLHNKS
jgi:hypothetical protein